MRDSLHLCETVELRAVGNFPERFYAWASSIAMERARTTSVPRDEDKITILAITELIKPECLSQWPILGHFDREPSIADFGT